MIGLIGVTGEIGKNTLSYLIKRDVSLCLLVREPDKVKHLLSDKILIRPFDFTKYNASSFDNIRSLIWTLPTNHTKININEDQWLRLARSAGVEHIVKLSVMRVEEDDIFHHRTSEIRIENSGISFTHLRPNTFMQNFTNYDLDAIKNRHELRFPAGVGKTSFIDARDISEVAAKILLQSSDHVNQAYTLTGPDALSYGEVARLFSDALGATINYVDTTDSDDPIDHYKIKHKFYQSLKDGHFAIISDNVAKILGRAPISMQQYIDDYKNHFK